MTLGDLIARLASMPQLLVFKNGFGEAMSYRGDYSCLAFRPKMNVTVADMLAECRAANGKTFEGYKGGKFTMSEWTDCYLAADRSDSGCPRIEESFLRCGEIEAEHDRLLATLAQRESEIERLRGLLAKVEGADFDLAFVVEHSDGYVLDAARKVQDKFRAVKENR